MKGLVVYRILTGILVPIAAMLAFFDVLALTTALANPALLIGCFMLACVVIYTFTSRTFLRKGIEAGAPCKHSLKDWIKVNAYVSLVFSFLTLFQAILILSNNSLLSQAMEQAMSAQMGMPNELSHEMIIKMMNGILYFMIFLSLILLVHIFIGFKLLKTYSHIFDTIESDK